MGARTHRLVDCGSPSSAASPCLGAAGLEHQRLLHRAYWSSFRGSADVGKSAAFGLARAEGRF
jgi:hypothetical protein